MPTFGTVKRTFPRVRIRKGYSPVDPTNLVQSFPILSDAEAEAIKSGMAVVLDSGKLQRATNILARTRRVYITQADGIDFSVSSSGRLPVIVCDGNYEVETAFYDDVAYNDGDLISVSETAGYFRTLAANAIGAERICGSAAKGTGPGFDETNSALRSYKGALPNTGFNDEADMVSGAFADRDCKVLSFYTRDQVVIA